MSTGKILAGALVGIGAIAAAPFTGGGSVLAGATLLTSLAGGTAVAAATGAAVAGATAGHLVGKKEEENQKEANKNHFKEGFKKGEIKVKEKFNLILKNQKERDGLMLLSIKIGVYVSKVDGVIDQRELDEINKLCLFISDNPTTPEFLKNEINKIINSNISFNDILSDLRKFEEGKTPEFKKKTKDFFLKLIETIIKADGHNHPKEISFFNIMKNQVFN